MSVVCRTLVLMALVVAAVPLGGQERRTHGRLFPPAELGLLEGPDRDTWQKPDLIMDALLIGDGSRVADLGAGGGWFTIRLARRVGPNGIVYAEDVQREMVQAIEQRIRGLNLKNVVTIFGRADDPGLPRRSVDAVLIVDAYHEMEDPIALLRNVERALSPKGVVGIVDFTKDGYGPGPPMDERVDPDRIIRDAGAAGLRLVKRPEFLRYQFMLIFGR